VAGRDRGPPSWSARFRADRARGFFGLGSVFTRCSSVGQLDSTFPIDARSILTSDVGASGSLRTEEAMAREIARHGDVVVREVHGDHLAYFDIWRGETLLGAFTSETDALIVALELLTFTSPELVSARA
jgi:hypothetical protein